MDFFYGLRALQRTLFVAAQKAFQTLMDAAIADLESGHGSASLDLAEKTAFMHIVRLLEEYLTAFTIMSPNDIDEFGDNYLTRTFPRALTGQLIHDCGVYALRIAYALSLVRDDLNLEFRFVRLPSHLALTISGPAIEGAVVFNNNQVFRIEKKVLDAFEAAWAKQAPKGSADAFWGHVAAGTYIEKVDMPFRTTAVPADPSGAALKDKLWATYKKVTRTDVFGTVTDKYLDQFNLRYLSVIEERQRIRHGFTFAIFTPWQQHGATLLERARAANSATSNTDRAATDATYKSTAGTYRAALEKVRAARRDAEATLKKKTEAVDQLLAQNPKLVSSTATKAQWQILDPEFKWEKVLDDYLAQVDARQPEPDFRFQFPTTD